MELYYFLNNSQNMDSQSRGFRLLFRCAGSFNYRPISFTLPITVSLLSYARSLSPSHWTLPLSSPPPFFPPYLFLSLTLPGYCPHSLLYHTVITLTPSFFYSFSHTLSLPLILFLPLTHLHPPLVFVHYLIDKKGYKYVVTWSLSLRLSFLQYIMKSGLQ